MKGWLLHIFLSTESSHPLVVRKGFHIYYISGVPNTNTIVKKVPLYMTVDLS